jgi:hypothetical protein
LRLSNLKARRARQRRTDEYFQCVFLRGAQKLALPPKAGPVGFADRPLHLNNETV